MDPASGIVERHSFKAPYDTRGGRLVHWMSAMATSLEKTRMKVLLLEGIHERAVENFAVSGVEPAGPVTLLDTARGS